MFYEDRPSVTFVRFEGETNSEGVVLNWETASELNNAGFLIERRFDTPTQTMSDTTDFFPIAFVEGSGTTTTSQAYTYIDASIPATASVVHYRIQQVDISGDFRYTSAISVVLPAPAKITLYPNYPEPFRSTTTVSFDLSRQSLVRLSLYNTTGQRVGELLNEVRPAGRYEFTIKLQASFTSGLYFLRLETPEETHTGTMTLIN